MNPSEVGAARTVRWRRRGGIYGSWSLPQNENGLTYLRIIRSIQTSHSVVLSLRMRDKSGDETELPPPTPPTYIPCVVFLWFCLLSDTTSGAAVRCDSQWDDASFKPAVGRWIPRLFLRSGERVLFFPLPISFTDFPFVSRAQCIVSIRKRHKEETRERESYSHRSWTR